MEEFAGGIFSHFYLSSFSYHRFHSPVSGVLMESRTIPGEVFLLFHGPTRNCCFITLILWISALPQSHFSLQNVFCHICLLILSVFFDGRVCQWPHRNF